MWPAFYSALGQFINQFGQTETALSFHLEQFAEGLIGGGTGDDREDLLREVLRALIGSKRSKDLAVSFNLCVKAWVKVGHKYPPEVLKEIDGLFSQLGHVRFLRDRTAHYSVQVEMLKGKVWFRALNRYTVNDLEKTEEIFFGIEHLEAASGDLKTIWSRLPFALGMHKRQPGDHLNPEKLPPWQYKPGSLVKRAYQFPTNPPRSSRPPSTWWER